MLFLSYFYSKSDYLSFDFKSNAFFLPLPKLMMLGVIFGYFWILMFLVFFNSRKSWCFSLSSSLFLVFISAVVFSSSHLVASFLYLDSLSYPLLVLSSLVVFLSMLASLKGSFKETSLKGFLFTLVFVGFTLYFCFLVNTFFGYFVFFELSVLPLIVLMTRWGAQKARLQASVYFMFFTMVGSFPLLVFFISFYNIYCSSVMGFEGLILCYFVSDWIFLSGKSALSLFWWFGVLGFLIKLPIYGFHLWLPKAHVEAPVAGSMLLAALLLKLGGYGLIRASGLLYNNMESYVVPFCFFGTLATAIICVRQTDLKALIAYSSVGHMSLVAGGILLNSLWGVSGAMMLMMAHGLISSCLFCLANLIYERTGSRTLKMTRGLSGLSFFIYIWWLLSCAANLGLPPFPKFLGELILMVSAVDASYFYLFVLGLSLIFSSLYSLFIYQKCCSGVLPSFFLGFSMFSCREHFLVFMHLFPLVMMLLCPGLCFSW